MAIQLQLRRGAAIPNATFIGAEGETVVDLDVKSLRVHDGIKPGGYELARSNLINASIAKTLLPTINATHDLGSPSFKFKDFYLSNHLYLGTVDIQPIPEGIRIVTSTGSFDLTQGIDEGSSPTFTSITIGDTTISELAPTGIRITKGVNQIDINQSLTNTSNVSFNSLSVSAEINIGDTSIVEEPYGISIDTGTKVIGLDQSVKTTDDVTFNSVTFGNVRIEGDTPSGIKFTQGTDVFSINQSLKKTDNVEFNQVTADLIGNASTADKLKTPFDISITGDVDVTIHNIDGDSDIVSTGSVLKTVNSAPGVYGDQSRVPIITVDSKGRVTDIQTQPVVAISTDFIIVADEAARDAIEPELHKNGMLVLTQDTNFLWQLIQTFYDPIVTIDNVTWNILAGNLELSNGNLTAKNTANNWNIQRATHPRNSGKYYFEVINTLNDMDYGAIGLGVVATVLGQRLGSDSNSIGFNFNKDTNPVIFQNGLQIPTSLASAVEGDVINVAVDFDTGSVWFGINGTWLGDPVVGDDPILAFASGTTLFPMVSCFGNLQTITGNFNPSVVPAGFLPWSTVETEVPPTEVWERFYVSPTRKILTFTTDPIEPLSFVDFDFMLGNCLIVYKLEVSEQCTFEVHEDSARADINPYKFITPTNESAPFVDNGLTYLADGAILRGRRYHIWASMEGGFDGDNRIYGRIYNHTENNYPSGINVTIWYMPIEKSLIL